MSSSVLNHWLDEVEKLIKIASSTVSIFRKSFKMVNQVFQAYVYTIIAYTLSGMGVRLSLVHLRGNNFVFKLNPRAYYYGPSGPYSYFQFRCNGGRIFSLAINLDTSVGQSILNLDIVLICLLYTSDAADDGESVDFGCCRII